MNILIILFYLQIIFKKKEKATLDLQRAKNNIRPTVEAKLKTRQRDEQIKNAWIELNAPTPWSVNKFINELSSHTVSFSIEVIEQGIHKD